MSWNNKAETEKWKTDQKRKMEMYLEANMSKESIQKIEEYDLQIFRKERAINENMEIFFPFSYDENDPQFRKAEAEVTSAMEAASDPFQYGFQNDRLNRIWQTGDEMDKQILKCLSMDMSLTEIANALQVSKTAISKRISDYKKFF